MTFPITKDTLTLLRLEIAIKRDVPMYKRRIKEDSALMRFLSFVVRPLNRHFMTQFVTTIYPSVYFPKEQFERPEMWQALAHEWVHLRRQKAYSLFVFAMSYLFPQNLCLLSLFSLGAISCGSLWLLNLLWLLFLLPVPSPTRMKEEMDAWVMSLAVLYWQTGHIDPNEVEEIVRDFISSDYYYMFPFQHWVRHKLFEEALKIKAGTYDGVYPHYVVRSVIKGIWTR